MLKYFLNSHDTVKNKIIWLYSNDLDDLANVAAYMTQENGRYKNTEIFQKDGKKVWPA